MEKKNSSEENLIDLEAQNNIPNSSPNGEKTLNPTDLESAKNPKRYKKPPRPSKPVPLDLLDQKLLNELTELTVLKKARIERMKALKKMKNSNSKSSNGNFFALIITVIFCLVILWHGIFSRGTGSLMSFHGSPEASILRSNGGVPFISVRIRNNATPSSSPKNMELESGFKKIRGSRT